MTVSPTYLWFVRCSATPHFAYMKRQYIKNALSQHLKGKSFFHQWDFSEVLANPDIPDRWSRKDWSRTAKAKLGHPNP